MTTRNHKKLCHIVDHVFNTWDGALERWTYLRCLGQNKEYTDALNNSYVAHVHNATQNVFVVDAMRELGAIILDRGEGSASLHHAIRLIKSAGVLDCIRKGYDVVVPVRHLNDDLPADVVADITERMRTRDLERNRVEFEDLHKRVNQAEAELFDSVVAKKVRKTRNKAVAHYDVRTVKSEWKTATIGDAGLTFGEMDAYFDTCSKAVGLVTVFVHRKSMSYDQSRAIFEKRAADYMDAVIRGRKSQLAEREESRKAAADRRS